jgi:uncharacterized membrane protein YhaH (DUF805 family)
MGLSRILFSFAGRLNRAAYWATTVGVYLIAALLLWAAIALALSRSPLTSIIHGSDALAIILAVAIVLALVWVGLALGIKRLHDRNKSGWWLLLFYFVPAVLHGLGRHGDAGGTILSLIGFAISIWALVELGFLRGTAGENRFGPDPLQPA